MFLWLLIIVYWLSRLTLLTSLAVFTDEANYLDWGWRMTHVPNHLFYSLYDAKQPFSMWLFGLSQNLFADPLFAGRLISVAFGFASLVGIYLLARELFNKQMAQLATISYLLSPLYLLFDRQALMESHLVAVGILSCLFLHKLLKTEKIRFALLLGLVLGVGFLIKSSSWIWIIMVAIYLIRKPILGIWTAIVTIFVSAPLLVQAQFWQTLSLNNRYVQYSVFGIRWENLRAILEIPFIQMTPIIFILGVWGIYKLRKDRFLLPWFILPLILQLFMAKFIISRYLIPFLWPLFIFAAVKMVEFRLKKLFLVLVVIVSLPLCLLQITKPVEYFQFLKKFTNYSYIEGYIIGETSGWAVNETVAWFSKLASDQQIALGLGLYSGNPEIGTMVYLQNHPNITTTFFDSQLFKPELLEFDCLQFDRPVYLLTRDKNASGLMKFVDPIREFTNPYGNNIHFVYKVKTQCIGKTLNLSTTRQQ